MSATLTVTTPITLRVYTGLCILHIYITTANSMHYKHCSSITSDSESLQRYKSSARVSCGGFSGKYFIGKPAPDSADVLP